MNRFTWFCVLLVSFSSLTEAQIAGTGPYSFGSFDSKVPDTVNVGNLNVHLDIPIFHKAGRGIPFNYDLKYDGQIWTPIASSGTQTWTPFQNFGWTNLTAVMIGYVSFATHQTYCGGFNNYTIFDTWVYHDTSGVTHPFGGQLEAGGECGTSTIGSLTATATDGSGFTLQAALNALGNGVSQQMTVTAAQGTSIAFLPGLSPISAATLTDRHGNQVSLNQSGVYTDTLGTPALTVSGSTSRSSSYNVTLAYPNPSGGTYSYTIKYSSYTIQTNFGCSGIGEYTEAGAPLISEIDLPNGTDYTFSYEPTPGLGNGSVTGRLASLTLPTGGTVNYSYAGGCNGSGINADGTAANLTRTTTDGSKSYTRSTVNANATNTILQDELGNQSLYQFTMTSAGGSSLYETHRQIYQGGIGGTPLLDQATCYNGVTSGCDGAAISLPISQTNVISSYNGGSAKTVVNTYDAAGMQTSSRQMSGSTTLESQTTAYNSLEEPTEVDTFDGSGSLSSQTINHYDETTPTPTSGIPQHVAVTTTPGNLTSSDVLVAAGSTIHTSTAYYDTGVPISTTTPNGTTQYGYDSTQTFVTQSTLPMTASGVQLSTSAAYDQQSGAQLSATGMNSGQTTQITQYDPLLRPASATLPNGSIVSLSYNGNDTVVDQTTGTGPDAITHSLVDAYGRKSRIAVFNGQSVNNWYQVDYCLDATGQLQFQTVRYQGGGWAWAKQCSGSGTTYTHDALGRVTSSANSDGTSHRQYNGRAVMTTNVNGVQRIIQHDLLGRISAVCEISSNASMPGSGSPGPCGMDIAGSGFLTNYSYNLTNHTTTVTQGVQTRVFQTDSAGRTIYTLEPERGVTNYGYAYNGTGLVVTRQRPKANQSNTSVLTTTQTQYDSIGRPLTVNYDDGITPTKNFTYDVATGLDGMNLGASKGQLAYGWTSPTLTATEFAYDSMGNVVQSVQCLPNRCGNSAFNVNMTYAYNLTGNLTKDTYLMGASSGTEVDTTYSVTPAGEVTSIANTLTGTTNYSGAVLSNIQNGPFGPTSYQYGNGRVGNSVYDGLGRLSGKNVFEPLNGYYPYYMTSTIQGSNVMQSNDSATNRNLTMSYDEFGRLTSAIDYGNYNSLGEQIGYTFGYDRWGNRWSQNVSDFEGASPQSTFNTANNQILGISYDAAGNMFSAQGYVYDAEGNLTSAGSAASVYDAFNNRVQLVQSGTTTQYAFNPSGQRSTAWQGTSSVPTLVEAVTYWNGQQVSYFDGTGTNFPHYDAFGTKREESNYRQIGGYIDGWTSNYTSLPFGDGFGDGYGGGGPVGDANHFAQLDMENSGLDHAQFREYDSGLGQWMSPDPYDGSYHFGNPQSFNRYAYVRNNPLGNVDPSGLEEDEDPCDDVTCFVEGGSGGGGGGGGEGSTPCLESEGCYNVTTTPLPPPPDTINLCLLSLCNIPQQNGPTRPAPQAPIIPTKPVSPTKPVPPTNAPKQVYQTQHQIHASENCRDGAVVLGVGVLSTIGAGVVVTIAWPEVGAASAIEGSVGESVLTLVHGAEGLGHLAISPLLAVGAGFNQMLDNCSTP